MDEIKIFTYVASHVTPRRRWPYHEATTVMHSKYDVPERQQME